MRTDVSTTQLVKWLSMVRHTPRRSVVIDGVECEPVGRNDVWRAALGREALFVTFCRTEGEFRRRLAGIDLSRSLAADSAGVGPLHLESTVDELKAIVVRETFGTRVDRLFRDAYRIDRNPLRRRAPRVRFQNALTLVLRFLRAANLRTPASPEHLWDYGPAGVLGRIQSQLESLSGVVPALNGWPMPIPPAPSTPNAGAVIGDPSMSNFIVDGDRVTCVDFEDLGVGDHTRDLVMLTEGLNCAFDRWHYWRDDANALVPLPVQEDAAWRSIYLLELRLMNVRAELSQRRSGGGLRAAVKAAQRDLLVMQRTGLDSRRPA